MRWSKQWRHRDELAELVTALKIRNALLSEVVVQRASNRIRSLLGINSVDAGTSERGTAMDTAAAVRAAWSADADADSTDTKAGEP